MHTATQHTLNWREIHQLFCNNHFTNQTVALHGWLIPLTYQTVGNLLQIRLHINTIIYNVYSSPRSRYQTLYTGIDNVRYQIIQHCHSMVELPHIIPHTIKHRLSSSLYQPYWLPPQIIRTTDYYVPRIVNQILSTENIATRRIHRGMTAITNRMIVARSAYGVADSFMYNNIIYYNII